MTMISKGTIGICAAVSGALFVGYCIYFDKKRRNDPNFKRRLREKRRRSGKSSTKPANIKWPNLKDPEAVQKFFLEQVQLGEELLSTGDIEDGIQHLSRAVAVCGQPQQLLQVLQQTLPPQVFQMLLGLLPSVGKSIMEAANDDDEPIVLAAKITEDDLE